MSSVRTPVGPQPPAVYWRRRLLVLVGLLAVIVVVVLIVVRPGSGSPDAQGSKSPSPSDSASPDPSATPDSSEACEPTDVALQPVTDANSYPPSVQPMISMTITNTSAVACTFDAGTGAQGYLIMSGSDRIWSSTDCQTAPTSLPIVLEPNVSQSTTPFPWDRTRSSTTTCDVARPPVTAGGATYRLSVTLGEAKSAGDVPFILQ